MNVTSIYYATSESSMNINLSFGFINFASFMYLEAKVQVTSIVKPRTRAILTSTVGKWRKLYAKKRMAHRLPENEDTFVQFVHRQLCNSKQKDLLIKDGSISFTLSRFISIHTWKFQTEKLMEGEHLECHASPLCSILNYIPRLYSTSKFRN